MLIFPDAGLEAQSRQVEVEVEVPIESGNLAAALDKAQLEAFKKAVEMTMPAGLDPVEQSGRIRNAATQIKSFRLLSQKEEAGNLFAKYSCEVVLGQAVPSQATPYYDERFAVEIVWNNPKQSKSLGTVLQKIQSYPNLKLGLIRTQRGSVWVEVLSQESPEVLRANLRSEFGSASEVKLHRDLEPFESNVEPSSEPLFHE
ncbi:MAG: hypothetical protein COV44_12085 [Deltaproteobacteria bacterium CG11_big_fil_rev_8_21_14_0_20_45_16]|nr:MAG: hypothetical protein COV44_12085 [Deltaproteobacteria bacterium CG11_big_fil_rev_8_21_14_0_20_45_16]